MSTGYGSLRPQRFRPSPRVALLAICWHYRTKKLRVGLAGVPFGNGYGPVQAIPGAEFGARSLQPRCTTRLNPYGLPAGLSLRLMLVVKPEKTIRSLAELRVLIRTSLRSQHPEWIEPNGNSPICDEYEARLVYLLGLAKLSEDRGAE